MKNLLGRLFLAFGFAVLLMLSNSIFAQHQELGEKPATWKENKDGVQKDSTSLLQAFKRGKMNGHFRYFFMGTNNTRQLSDYFANAIGGGLRYETANFHGFKLALSGFYIFNIGSSDLTKPDSTTGSLSRYEIGLFDIEDPTNKVNIDRLEELHLKYQFRKSTITLGRQLINTPFINLQDGRMRPTTVDGIWLDINELNNTKIELGYLYGIQPRSTTRFLKVEETFGVYPSGVGTNGVRSAYKGNIESLGVINFAVTNQSIKGLKLQFWNLFVDNVFNTNLLQADYSIPTKSGHKFSVGLQTTFQTAVNDGGNPDQAKTYMDKGAKSFVMGGKMGWAHKEWDISLNYTHITSLGRYLMPREWGRDHFYTFMPRERNEGAGGSHAVVIKANKSFPKQRIKTSVAVGYFDMPDVSNVALNKYGMPSFLQANLDVRYVFGGFMKGFDIQLLLLHKFNTGDTKNNDKFVFNKVEMSTVNLVLNYHF